LRRRRHHVPVPRVSSAFHAPPAADPRIREIAQRLLRAERRTSSCRARARSEHRARTRELWRAARAAGRHVGLPCLSLLPENHPLNLGAAKLSDADVVVALDANVPYVPAAAPPPAAYVAVIDPDPVRAGIRRTNSRPTCAYSRRAGAIRALTEAVARR